MPAAAGGSDVDMQDVPLNTEPETTAEFDDDRKPLLSSLRVLPGDSNSAASFEIMHEDHTLGNALRYVIMKNPDVEFCGYSIPHPSDPKMNLRIQTYDDVSVYDVLEKGLNDLMDLCDVVTEKFTAARDAHPKDA